MQFGREPLPQTSAMSTADGDRGWVCSDRTEHFQLVSHQTSATTVVKATVPPR